MRVNGPIQHFTSVDLKGVLVPDGMMATHPYAAKGAASDYCTYIMGLLNFSPQKYMPVTWHVVCAAVIVTIFVAVYVYYTREWARLRKMVERCYDSCGPSFKNSVAGDIQTGCLWCAGVDQVELDHFDKDYQEDVITVLCCANNCSRCFWSGKPLWMVVNMDGSYFYTAYSQIREALNKTKDTVMTNTKFAKSNRVTSLGVSGFLKAKLQYGWVAIAAMALNSELCRVVDKEAVEQGVKNTNFETPDATLNVTAFTDESMPYLIRQLPEAERENLIHVKDGYGIVGYMTAGSLVKLRKDVTHEWKEFDQMDLNQIRRDAFIEEYHGVRDWAGTSEAHEYLLRTKRPMQAVVIGPYCKDSYIASKHSKCLTDALSGRHYTDDGTKTYAIPSKYQKLLLTYTRKMLDVVKQVSDERKHMMQHHENADGKPTSPQDFNFSNGDVEPIDMCAGKWAEKRKMSAADFITHIERDAKKKKGDKGNRMVEEIELLKKSMGYDQPESDRYQATKRSVFVKLNEVLGKVKPRMIVSGGDEACMLHTLDCFTAEALIFACAFFESRSVKHADGEELRDRFAERLAEFQWAMSNDYGRFDSTLSTQIRELVENFFIRGMLTELSLNTDCPNLRNALADRLKGTLVLNAPFWTAIIGNPGRESGDRGTSVLNYLTGIVVFCVLIHMEIVGRCKSHKNKIMWSNAPEGEEDEYAEHVIEMWFRGDKVGFDFFGEGDDNLPLFTDQFIGGIAGFSKSIVDRFVHHAAKMGLILEPQYVGGAAPKGEGLYPVQGVKGRVEFTSKIIKIYMPDKDMYRAAMIPKIEKFLKSISISFATTGDVQVIAMTKILSMMQNVIDVPLMFRYAMILYRYHFMKYKLHHNKSADVACRLDDELLNKNLGTFDAARLIKDLEGKEYAKEKSFSAMFKDMTTRHVEVQLRGGEKLHSAVAAAIMVECPDFTVEKQYEALVTMEKLYDQMEHDFRRVYSAAMRKSGVRAVTWETLVPHIDDYYAYLCSELNTAFRGYFCEVFWGSKPPAITLAGA